MTKVDQLRDLTKNLGGVFKEFSQSYAQIKSARIVPGLFTSDKQNLSSNVTDLYVGGMCHCMSLFWLVGQAGGLARGNRFIRWVMTDDKTSINMSAVGVLVAKTVMYKSKGPRAQKMGLQQSGSFDDDFFARYKIANKQESHAGFYEIQEQVAKKRDRMFMISYLSGSGGHACAAQATAEGGFAYFDPNYGEAAVVGSDNWKHWYTQYLRISNYQNKYTAKQVISGYKHRA